MKILGTPKATPEQLKIIGDTRTGTEIIRGAAGSGKTTTALLRLRNLSDMFRARHTRLGITDPVKALVLTYNRTLCGYVSALASSQAAHGAGVSTTVQTYAQWAMQFSAIRNIRDDRIGLLHRLAHAEGLVLPPQFLNAEIEYVLGRFPAGSYERYLDVERTGRGIAPRVEKPAREKIIKVIELYKSENYANGVIDWEDLSSAAIGAPNQGYQIVVVDEAQDFSANQIRSIKSHVANVHALTLVIDTAQRLYPRGYVWAEAGIEARGAQFYRLSKNHRNTVEIARFARGILDGLTMDDDATLPDFAAASRSGAMPQLIVGKYDPQLDWAINFLKTAVNHSVESVGFLKPLGGDWFKILKRRLDKEGFSYDEITKQIHWPGGNTNIVLSTMHSAKGLEFDHVVILGLNAQVTPHGHEDGDDQLVTLRRLLAMAVSRARKTVQVGYKNEEASDLVSYFQNGTYQSLVV